MGGGCTVGCITLSNDRQISLERKAISISKYLRLYYAGGCGDGRLEKNMAVKRGAKTRREQPESDGNPTRHISYLAALQDLAHRSQKELGRLMPHYGERGRIAEEIIKSVLEKTLPKRFSIGTGVVFSADGQVSSQTDT